MQAAARHEGRDTDADWRELGATQPYWGVLTHADYRTENLTPANLEAFYASGADHIGDIVRRLTILARKAPGGRALDFGCGTGRLARAMCDHAGSVTGYDISPGMLDEARLRGGGATYVDALPDGPFDWINSFIVFQHIAPRRGLAILEDLLARLADDGVVSLHLTVWRDARVTPEVPRGWRRLAQPLLARWRLARLKPGAILMYDYDLSAVVRLLNKAGLADLTLITTDHGGHHGVIILGRKTARPPTARSPA
ncbi:class I SAM-dependent methyltransferase [Phenylobacterium sp.]|uniref:class I SAM-dependent methyltransferase n=1 Tax=Phenylobacterium sp. TaxID=1871053 RepID=UPI00286A1C34|nr:class I SAM-dependent methyltransferase [Phenylobacterium sp.]